MGLISFSCVMIGVELFLITDNEYARIRLATGRAWERVGRILWRAHGIPVPARAAARQTSPRLCVYFDGWCHFCQRTVRILSRLDLMGVCEFVSFRGESVNSPGSPPLAEFERRMQVLDRASITWAGGHTGLRLLSRHMVVLWPLRPFLALAGRLGIGDRVYDWIAARRLIVPNGGRCGAACRPGAPSGVPGS